MKIYVEFVPELALGVIYGYSSQKHSIYLLRVANLLDTVDTG